MALRRDSDSPTSDRDGGGSVEASAPEVPVVAAASDLQFALADVATEFSTKTGRRVEIAFGSSGNFLRQIRQGAPFQIFLSADEAFVEDLAADGIVFGDSPGWVEACVIPHAFHIIQGGRYHRQAGEHFNPYTYDDIKTIADHLHFVGSCVN